MTIKDMTLTYDGDRRGVLLIHGLGGTPVEMKTIANRLAAAGRTVICCQLAGHCGNENDLMATDWKDWYASVEEALYCLEERCDRIVVGGLSMGALLAARLAAYEPERVQGLVMLAPTLWHDGWSIPSYEGALKALKFLIDTPFGRLYKFVEREPYGVKDERIRMILVRAMNSGDSTAAGLLGTPARSLRELWRMVEALKPDLPRIRQNTLIVHPRHDDIASLENAFYLQRNLGGRVEVLILEDSYHLVTVDKQRAEVSNRFVEFVESLRGPAVSRGLEGVCAGREVGAKTLAPLHAA
jgi:carboxylesterase